VRELSRELRRPRTKPTLSPFLLRSGEILLARDVYGLGLSIKDDRRRTIWRLLGLMDGRRSTGALAAQLRSTDPGVRTADVRAAIARLRRLGVLEEGEGRSPAALSAPELARYSRNLEFLSLVSLGTGHAALDLQRRLKRARVTILGVGAIGSAMAASLAAAGVGRLRLIDPDRIEVSNLNRQLLYGTSDVGRFKVDVARSRIAELNPHVRVSVSRRRVRSARDLPPLLADCDLFVLGADQPHDILLWTNDAAYAARVPWLENSYGGPRCAIALFVPGRTPCLRCLQQHLTRGQVKVGTFEGELLLPEARPNPVVAATAGVAAHFGALQALYFLTGLPAASEGRLVQLNLWEPGDVRVERPPYWRACPVCRRPTLAGSRRRRRGGRSRSHAARRARPRVR